MSKRIVLTASLLVFSLLLAGGVIMNGLKQARAAVSSPKSQANFQDIQALEQLPEQLTLIADGEKQTLQSENLTEKLVGATLLQLADNVNRKPRNAELKIEAGRATSFQPHLTGRRLLAAEALSQIRNKLSENRQAEVVLELPMHRTEPLIYLGDLNSLGIKELIGRGASDFSGSPASRVHNIKVGASKFNGIIVNPGEEFSFNQHLGPVTASTGYLPELVIKPEGTVPEFGGGLCQVSSTAFRAAFFSGTEITQRKNHSYAVKYYEWINEDLPASHGMDATIYPGAVDMKFLNDTPGAILVWTRIEASKLYFDFYGTPDDRQVVVEELKTYDRRASGAMKATVTRTVKKGGEESTQTFNSNYASPDLFPRVYGYATEANPEQPAETNDSN